MTYAWLHPNQRCSRICNLVTIVKRYCLLLIAQPETIQETLFNAIRALGVADSYNHARLEAELLLAHTLGISRAYLLACLGEPIETEKSAHFAAQVARRAQGEPLAYILGQKEFFGLEFVVDRRVLIPRAETELVVERGLEILEHRRWFEPTVIDVGTGSGAIVIALASRVSRLRFIATDISRDAIEVAKLNAGRLGTAERIDFCEGDLLEPIRGPVHLLVANLPYIPIARESKLPREIRENEPRVALFGGFDGLSVIRRMLGQARERLARGGHLLFEMDEEQGEDALALARDKFPRANVTLHRDLEGLDRFVEIQA